MPTKNTIHLYKWTEPDEQNDNLNTMENIMKKTLEESKALRRKLEDEKVEDGLMISTKKHYAPYVSGFDAYKIMQRDHHELIGFYLFLNVVKKLNMDNADIENFVLNAPMHDDSREDPELSYYWINLISKLDP
jgi:hypothetical protein